MFKLNYKNVIPVAAHRGNSFWFPENTLPAFRSALESDADMIETDIRMSKDGQLVLLHDRAVDRTTSGTGLVKDMTLSEIKKLDAGGWKSAEFLGTQVPTFIEFLELTKNRTDLLFNIELKDLPEDGQERAYESADKAIALMEQYHISDKSVINSWSGALLEHIDNAYSHKYRLHGYHPLSLMGEGQKRSAYDYLYCICPFVKGTGKVADEDVFSMIRQRGIEPWVYYSDTNESDYAKALIRGAMLITSNDPARTILFLQKKNLHT